MPFVIALIAVVVGVDVMFFRHRFWERLMVNVGIVLVFAARLACVLAVSQSRQWAGAQGVGACVRRATAAGGVATDPLRARAGRRRAARVRRVN